uniref:Uncharacterized protein n=1 Tax=Anguilla anguilla TaxID=7936 RepID=A0A0E9VSF8_ANGAN
MLRSASTDPSVGERAGFERHSPQCTKQTNQNTFHIYTLYDSQCVNSVYHSGHLKHIKCAAIGSQEIKTGKLFLTQQKAH